MKVISQIIMNSNEQAGNLLSVPYLFNIYVPSTRSHTCSLYKITYMFPLQDHIHVPCTGSNTCSLYKIIYKFPLQDHIHVPCTRSHTCSLYKITYMFLVQDQIHAPSTRSHTCSLYKITYMFLVQDQIHAPSTRSHTCSLYKITYMFPLQDHHTAQALAPENVFFFCHKIMLLPISNPKPDRHNINAHTKFGDNPLTFSQVIIPKRKIQMNGHTTDRRMDGTTNMKPLCHYHVAGIPCHYHVVGYVESLIQ